MGSAPRAPRKIRGALWARKVLSLPKKVSCLDDNIGDRELFFDGELAELEGINRVCNNWQLNNHFGTGMKTTAANETVAVKQRPQWGDAKHTTRDHVCMGVGLTSARSAFLSPMLTLLLTNATLSAIFRSRPEQEHAKGQRGTIGGSPI